MKRICLFWICLFFLTLNSQAQVPIAQLYPEWGLIDYVESSTSAQYQLQQAAKPKEFILFMKQEETGLTFAIKKNQRKDYANCRIMRDDTGGMQIDFTFLAPGLKRPLVFMMDRVQKNDAGEIKLAAFRDAPAQNDCHHTCIDQFLDQVQQLEEEMSMTRMKKAIRDMGYESEEFARYEEKVIELMQAYWACKKECNGE